MVLYFPQLTYRNVYCARCNDDGEDVVQWTMKCRHNQYLYDTLSDRQYDLKALQLPRICGAVRNRSPQAIAKIQQRDYEECEHEWYVE